MTERQIKKYVIVLIQSTETTKTVLSKFGQMRNRMRDREKNEKEEGVEGGRHFF